MKSYRYPFAENNRQAIYINSQHLYKEFTNANSVLHLYYWSKPVGILPQVLLPLIPSVISMCRVTKTKCWFRSSCITSPSRLIRNPVNLRVSAPTNRSSLPWRWTKLFRWCTTHWPQAKCYQPQSCTGGVPLLKVNKSIISPPVWRIRRLWIWNFICRIARPGKTRVHPVARSVSCLP